MDEKEKPTELYFFKPDASSSSGGRWELLGKCSAKGGIASFVIQPTLPFDAPAENHVEALLRRVGAKEWKGS